ncbi:autoinducer 2 ABC transporter substrate-binding protein LsrB [Geotoga petraea]|jgi:AI-2 transport system substrate-binding protein|uniref:Autoinducer 2-binding protein LsrB n=1 Tax=Geotoga petraea TaxID=28234 RepID=A0A4Z0W0V0_9BACT|nr:autoinducer 2 ABC transporter substrate-binding protein LsrB [Geotoga petraea]MDK2946777.1 transport system substrate-binding protein [Geotoga sp.]TGG88007.1 autoinducer 2 ABC transporter substrate-binding protein LsrB [Geotoga petraea]
MKKGLIVLTLVLVLLTTNVFALKFFFIPKMIGENFFEVAGKGALEMGEQLGVEVIYDGPSEASVSEQVRYINTAINMGADAILISSNSPTGLNQALKRARDRGVLVLTWDSDVTPSYRDYYINQGTPDILGRLLVQMVENQIGTIPTGETLKVAFHYSSPTVTDQNAWTNVAKEIIKNEKPNWEIVTTQYSDMNFPKAVSTAEQILNTYPDIDAIICPDSTAFPGTAKAVENLNKSGEIAVVGFTTPSVIKPYIERGTVLQGGLWDAGLQGAASVYVAYQMLENNVTYEVGDSFTIPGVLGEFDVLANSEQGYDKEFDDLDKNGLIVLPERLIFTRYNVDKYNF